MFAAGGRCGSGTLSAAYANVERVPSRGYVKYVEACSCVHTTHRRSLGRLCVKLYPWVPRAPRQECLTKGVLSLICYVWIFYQK